MSFETVLGAKAHHNAKLTDWHVLVGHTCVFAVSCGSFFHLWRYNFVPEVMRPVPRRSVVPEPMLASQVQRNFARHSDEIELHRLSEPSGNVHLDGMMHALETKCDNPSKRFEASSSSLEIKVDRLGNQLEAIIALMKAGQSTFSDSSVQGSQGCRRCYILA